MNLNDYYEDDDIQERERPGVDDALNALHDSAEGKLSASIFYGLSDLTPDDLERVKPVWDKLDPEYRLKLVQQMTELSEVNYDLDYHNIGHYALNDPDPEVRAAAVDLLWDDESVSMMTRLIEMAQWDEAIPVRAAAASALGQFILLGELGEMDERETVRAQDAVVSLLTDEDEDIDVRRRALEAIANCGHEIVEGAIEDAYYSADERMKASAIFAMGRTCDERWEEIVLREIDSSNPVFRYEAARASGELELREAVPALARLSHESDREIQEVAIWSLGEIGGIQALKVLTRLAEEAENADDEDLLDLIDDAISSASLAGSDLDFDLDDRL